MAAPSSTDLLDLWDRTAGLGHPERAVSYAEIGESGTSARDLRDQPVGHRDAAVLRLRATTFGRRLVATAVCPRCAQVMELEIDVAALIPAADELHASTIEVESAGTRIRCRLPTTSDVLATQSIGGGPRALAERCIERTSDTPDPLSDELIEVIGARMAEADPAADIHFEVACAGCGFVWATPFDIVSIVDAELDAWARLILHDVAALARAFGWTQDNVLALSPARRRRYLELATA